VWNGTRGVLNYFGTGKETLARDREDFVFDGVIELGTDQNGNPVYVDNFIEVNWSNPEDGLYANKWGRYGFNFTENEIEDASWIRLREISLNYQLPDKLNGPFHAVTITLSGRNLLLITNYKGLDPEMNVTSTNGFGMDYFGNPNTKSFGAQINLGL
jgi:hypothetical protein